MKISTVLEERIPTTDEDEEPDQDSAAAAAEVSSATGSSKAMGEKKVRVASKLLDQVALVLDQVGEGQQEFVNRAVKMRLDSVHDLPPELSPATDLERKTVSALLAMMRDPWHVGEIPVPGIVTNMYSLRKSHPRTLPSKD